MPQVVEFRLTDQLPDIHVASRPDDKWDVHAGAYNRNPGIENAPSADQTFGATLSVAPLYATTFQASDGTWYWVYLSESAATQFAFDGTVHTDITGGGLNQTVGALRSHTSFNGFLIYSNNLDAPHSWDGTVAGNFAVIPGWPRAGVAAAQAGLIRSFRFHLVALNYTEDAVVFESGVRWSSAAPAGALPTSWSPLVTNDAGALDIADMRGPIVAAEVLGDALIIFSTTQTYALEFIGGNEVFQLRKLSDSIGAFSSDSVAEYQGNLYVASQSDLMVLDRNGNYRSIAHRRVQNAFFGGVSMPDSVQVTARPRFGEVYFLGLIGATQNELMVYQVQGDTWSQPLTLVGGLLRPRMSVAFSNGEENLYIGRQSTAGFVEFDTGTAADSRSMSATKTTNLGTDDRRKLVTRVRPVFIEDVSEAIIVNIASADKVNVALDDPLGTNYNGFSDNEWISVDKAGIWHQFTISYSGNVVLRLAGLDVEFTEQGRF